MISTDLEKLIHRKLNELPGPAAPPTLLPRVLAAVHRQLGRPWYKRAWLTWPREPQAVSIAVLAGVLVGLAVVEPSVQATWSGILSALERPVNPIAGEFLATLGAAGTLRRALLEPVFGYVVVPGVLMGTACAALLAALTRVAGFGGASQS